MGEFEVKKETKYEASTKNDLEGDIADVGHEVKEGAEDAKDKVKAGAKAMLNKVKDHDRELETEYEKEKIKGKID
jgi:hypothetical protein